MLNWHIRHAELVSASQHLTPVHPGNKEIPKPVRNDNRAFAFTLAEVLITLVIIGVVAALTIPNLLQKYQEQTTVKKVQKFYSTLSNAYSLAMKDNGPVGEWEITYNSAGATKIYNLLFKPYFKIVKNCGINNQGFCISNNTYKRLNNDDSASYGTNTNFYKIALDDSSSIFWRGDASMIIVFYDINGPKAPNQWGKDLFDFYIVKNKAYPAGTPALHGTQNFKTDCRVTGDGYTCPAWVVYKGNMDYLHCDDLSWTGKDKCK